MEEELFEANADSITYERDANNNLTIVLKYVRIPDDCRNVKLTLTMPPPVLEQFLKTVAEQVRQAPSSTSKH